MKETFLFWTQCSTGRILVVFHHTNVKFVVRKEKKVLAVLNFFFFRMRFKRFFFVSTKNIFFFFFEGSMKLDRMAKCGLWNCERDWQNKNDFFNLSIPIHPNKILPSKLYRSTTQFCLLSISIINIKSSAHVTNRIEKSWALKVNLWSKTDKWWFFMIQ